MRIRLRLLLPLLVVVLVGGGFILAAVAVGAAVHEALLTVPGLTRERAVERAVHALWLVGVVVTAVGLLASLLAARLIIGPLTRVPRTAEQLTDHVREESAAGTVVAEVQDVARGISRAAAELRDRHGRELRERSELAALVDAVSEGIVQLDAQGRIVRVNQASRTLLRLPDDAVGRPIGALLRSAELRQMMARGASGDRTEAAELVLDELRVLVSIAPQPEGGAVATFVDLTDLRRLEEVRRDFVANASHELKTPLTSIRGYTETLLADDLPDAERRQFLDTIARNTERLQRIVDDLLDLSRLESGRWQPDLEPVHLLEIAEKSWLGFAERAAARDIGFRTQGDHDLARADRRALEQIFANLYDNALRYTTEQGRIEVSAKRRAGPLEHHAQNGSPGEPVEGQWLVVAVNDSGSGIPRDALPRIFERFYRADPARSRAEGGTGLGLSIVKHMLESMGGSVRAESALGKGTTIELWLPAVES